MSDIVIKVENLSKQYRLGLVSTGTLAHDLNRWWCRVRGKDDPYLKVGESNDRTSKGASEYVWALRDINFEVKRGEVLGIIGRNGAGKSTLLKILSRVTAPTTGSVKARGRIASLLEVGTGFHPELTGRENVYLNGAINGMTQAEVTKKLDEIVDFSGCERYIDTPVKRYSSGMTVRLGFAVAANLEPEILIVDEVLAVGDAEFQKKCLGKMGDVSKEGRTILFVSHNMTAMQSLCSRAVWINDGQIIDDGETGKIIANYLQNSTSTVHEQVWENVTTAPGNNTVRLHRVAVVPDTKEAETEITILTPLRMEFEFWNLSDSLKLNLSLHLYNNEGMCIFASASPLFQGETGLTKGICHIPSNLLNDGVYRVMIMIVKDGSASIFEHHEAIIFEVHEIGRTGPWFGKWPGMVRPRLEWTIDQSIGVDQ
jgi:lipopolysaccharide transport system ATP-binding protein